MFVFGLEAECLIVNSDGSSDLMIFQCKVANSSHEPREQHESGTFLGRRAPKPLLSASKKRASRICILELKLQTVNSNFVSRNKTPIEQPVRESPLQPITFSFIFTFAWPLLVFGLAFARIITMTIVVVGLRADPNLHISALLNPPTSSLSRVFPINSCCSH